MTSNEIEKALLSFKKERIDFVNEYIQMKDNRAAFLKLRTEIHKTHKKLFQYYTKEHNKLNDEIEIIKTKIDDYNQKAIKHFESYLLYSSDTFKKNLGVYYKHSLIKRIDGDLSFSSFEETSK